MWPLRIWLLKKALLDHPNDRSSHTRPTPRGGGLVVIAVIGLFWGGLGGGAVLPLAIIGTLLAATSWIDDVRGLPATVRLLAQAVAVFAALELMPAQGLLFQGLLAPEADRILAGLAWVWFINLFNFMDGIDGIAGMEAVCIAIGLMLIGALTGSASTFANQAPALAAVAGAALGFLCWNWQPAKIFLGDVGSTGLGFFLGALLLQAAWAGLWAAALILPLAFLADATWTLLRRLFQGKAIWRAHREHIYQRAVDGGRSHRAVCRALMTINAGLLGTALMAETHDPVLGLAAACVLIAAAGWWLSRKTPPSGVS